MGLALACMLGEIGKPGVGFGFGYGSMMTVGRSIRHLAWPSLSQGRNAVRDFIPVARVTDMLLIRAALTPTMAQSEPIRTFDSSIGLAAIRSITIRDLHRLEEAWTRPETVIVNEIWWTATARRADIVFPVTSPLERADIMMNRRDPSLIFMEKLIEPIGASRDDYDVFRGLAKRLGVHEAFTQERSQEVWLREIWREAIEAAKQDGFDLPDFDAFRRLGKVEVPEIRRDWVQFEAFVADPGAHSLKTKSGRIEISSKSIASFGIKDCPGHPVWREPIEWLGAPIAKGMVHLISGQPMNRLHAQLDNGPVSLAAKIAGREAVYLHPSTAAAYGVADGDVVLLENARGRALGRRDTDGGRASRRRLDGDRRVVRSAARGRRDARRARQSEHSDA